LRKFVRPAGVTLQSDGPPLLILQNWASGPAPPAAPISAALDQFDTSSSGAGSAGCVLANRLSADPNIAHRLALPHRARRGLRRPASAGLRRL